ncbi:BMP family ABC transporter substrate-binding protein [Fictibacillus fluitans]|uniref:BMP family ABC transporter substrate-binding protein n=1 Tax=Fictibacillus fluitans TaxID=3058422 RepID=A0ABT8HSD7_9BACL|nr:BMP family ABC transporter substrate-binding protein [Fictibacillus sp. NE201]MDN4523673.1 BMP family ABC transporter substrate-binding protein [Fictibacillus sp. NE201]
MEVNVNKMKTVRWLLIACLLAALSGCQEKREGNLKNTGLLVQDTINDQGWADQGYKGLIKIQDTYGNEVVYKEKMQMKAEIKQAVEEFQKDNVNLIFGHGKIYANLFSQISRDYPKIRFVSFNGDSSGENATSIHFRSYAMGFFAGMVAAKMSRTNHLGVIAAQEWQPEMKGFAGGARFQKKDIIVDTEVMDSWSDKDQAIASFKRMAAAGADVFYPTGDGYTVPVIEEVKRKALYAIGYVTDQSDLGRATVLTSTVQNVEYVYKSAAEQFDAGKLRTGNLQYGFKEKAIAMGRFSPLVPSGFQKKIRKDIEEYKKTGKLPNGKSIQEHAQEDVQ